MRVNHTGEICAQALYSAQALLPIFSQEYGVSPATASLTLSVSTGVFMSRSAA